MHVHLSVYCSQSSIHGSACRKYQKLFKGTHLLHKVYVLGRADTELCSGLKIASLRQQQQLSPYQHTKFANSVPAALCSYTVIKECCERLQCVSYKLPIACIQLAAAAAMFKLFSETHRKN